MRMWLYQLNQTTWPPELFRRDIWEGKPWHFKCGKLRRGNEQVSSRGKGAPKLGEVVLFFYAEAGGSDPGVYGWGVIDRIEEAEGDGEGEGGLEDRLHFIPSAPTNHLKMDPWWDGPDGEVKEITSTIRRPVFAATLFQVHEVAEAPADTIRRIQDGIKKWLSPGR